MCHLNPIHPPLIFYMKLYEDDLIYDGEYYLIHEVVNCGHQSGMVLCHVHHCLCIHHLILHHAHRCSWS
jgi:hypothetical protein